MSSLKTISIFALPILLITCNKSEQSVAPNIANEELTTVQLHLVNSANSADSVVAQWQQLLDNNGNPLPVDTTQAQLPLKANTTYKAHVIILDRSQTPVFNVTTEILARENYHLFFYQPLPTNLPLVIPNNYPTDLNDLYPLPIPTPVPSGSPLPLTVTITDHDTNSQQYPVGLQSNFVTGSAGKGWLRVVLRHQPNAKNGTFAPGSSDLDVGYSVTIK